MKKKIIIFDMDGVLVNSEVLSREYMMSVYPAMTVEMHKELSCGNFHEEMEKFKAIHPPVSETTEEKEARQAAFAHKKINCPLYEDISELLHTLNGLGHTLVINTSAVARNCLPLLEKAGVAGLFDFVATAEIARSKVEKFNLIQARYKADKTSFVFITDTLGDVREASAAHVPTIAVTWGMHDRSYFIREPHDTLLAIVDTVKELEQLIK